MHSLVDKFVTFNWNGERPDNKYIRLYANGCWLQAASLILLHITKCGAWSQRCIIATRTCSKGNKSTVDWEIFVAENLRWSPSTPKIKPTKYFLQCINGVSLYFWVVIATKIKPGKNLADKVFFPRKVSDLWYNLKMVHKRSFNQNNIKYTSFGCEWSSHLKPW